MTIFIIVGLLLSSIIFFIPEKAKKNNIVSYILPFLIIFISYFIVVGVLSIPIANALVPVKYEYGWENKIISLNDSKAYIVSRRSVDQQDRFYYAVQYNGYVKTHWVNQSNSRIIEVENNPSVKVFVQKRQLKNWFYKDINRILEFVGYDDLNLPKRYDFYVPKGTLVQDFSVDLN